MTPDEKNLISGLFQRLKDAEAQLGPRDREADELIRQSVAAQPTVPYMLVQTVLVQEHALSNATTRIAELEKQLAESKAPAAAPSQGGGSFLGNMAEKLGPWGRRPSAGAPAGGAAPQPQMAPVPMAQPAMPYGQPAPGPYAPAAQAAAPAGGGFLRSALTTAAGVAGGALLFQGISSLLSHNSGPFGQGLASHDAGSSAWGGGGGGAGETVINNYYGGAPDPAAGTGGAWQPDDTGSAPGYQESGWNSADGGADYADDGSSFDGGGDDV